MQKREILSKVLGSKFFKSLWKEDKRFSLVLNVNNLDVNFQRNIKYFDVKKKADDALTETMEMLENSIADEEEISKIYNMLSCSEVNQYEEGDKEEYLYKYHFDDIHAITLSHFKIVHDFTREESVFKSALDKYDLSTNQFYFKENWIAKYTPLYKKSIDDESNFRYGYDGDLKFYRLTALEIKLKEEVFIFRQRFKCRFKKIAKELGMYQFNQMIIGVKYDD